MQFVTEGRIEMARNRVVVFSCDAMVWEDVEYLLTKPRFKALFEKCSVVKRMRTIYPSVTYPCHTSMSTGAYPDKHGVTNNSIFSPGQLKNVPWNWFADAIKCPDIFEAAKRAGLTTACLFWPVTAGHKYIDYNIPEYWPQSENDTKKECFLRAGTSEELWNTVVEKNIEGVKIRTHPDTDQFLIDSACDIIKTYKPHLLMLHTGDVDSYRHRNGLFNERVTRGVDDTERWFYDVIEATKSAGVYEETNFFLVSDHGQLEIVRNVKPNVVFADKGLITLNDDGSLADWQAYCHSTGLSAQVRLKDPTNKELYDKTYEILQFMCEEGIYGISRVMTAEEADKEEHLNGEFSFVLESDGYSSFSEDYRRPMVAPMDLSDYRFGKATHGHNPDKGPQPVFLGFGPDIKQGPYYEGRW